MTKIIDGKKVAQKIKDKLKSEITSLGIEPGLAVILVGDDQASKVYVKNKKKACDYVGIRSFSYELASKTKENELLELIDKLNNDKSVNGILVQLPLPDGINAQKILEKIDPIKDVDGFHPINVGRLYTGSDALVPCTPAGILELLKQYSEKIESKHAVVVGRSNIVGKPVSQLLLREGATVSICHSKTKELGSITRQADILVVAVGKAKLIKKDMIKKNVVVIDVGMNRDENGKLCGDVDYSGVFDICSAITPVPGGVGPMTIAMLLDNCLLAWKIQNDK